MIYVPMLWRDNDATLPDRVHFVLECKVLKSRADTPLVWAALHDHPSHRYENEEYYRLVKNRKYGFVVLVTHSDVGMGYPNLAEVRKELDFHMPLMVSYLKFDQRARRGA